MVAAVVLGLLIGAALGALGGGGSILAVPVLVYIAGQAAGAATSTSLVAVGAAAAVGALTHARAHRVRWVPALAFVATGIGGSWLGSHVNERIDGDVLLLCFSGLILVAAHRMLTACPSCTREGEEQVMAAAAPEVDAPGAGRAATPADAASAPPSGSGRPVPASSAPAASAAPATVAAVVGPGVVDHRAHSASGRGSAGVAGAPRPRLGAAAIARVVLAGSVVGFLTGLFGVGGGFVIVPALTLALGMSMPVAIGTSLLVIVGNAVTALAFRGLDAVDWSIALPFTATMLVGSLLGSNLSHRLPAKQTLLGFSVLLVAVALANALAASVALWG